MPRAQIASVRRRLVKGRQVLVLGEPPKKLKYAVRQTREMMRDLTALVVKVHGHTSLHHLQLISEWAEAEVSRRLLWTEWRNKYPEKLTTEQVCMLRKDTQRYAAEKSRCIKELRLDSSKMDAYERALSEDDEPELIDPGADVGENPEGYLNSAQAFVTTCRTEGGSADDGGEE